jgi:hypothetical protein
MLGQVRPGLDRIGALEQAREAADLARLVLLAALHDHVAGDIRADDLACAISGSAEHAHGVIVREDDVVDGLVGDLAHALDHRLGHPRRRLRVEDEDAVVADHDPGIGVALRSVGVDAPADLVEGDRLLAEVRAGCEGGFSPGILSFGSFIVRHGQGLLFDRAEDRTPSASFISMRKLSPKRRNGVTGAPVRMISTMRCSAMQA